MNKNHKPLIPIKWINLNSAIRRRHRMNWAISEGGWKASRFEAIDGLDRNQLFLPIANPLMHGQALPGIMRFMEENPNRKTNRNELACFASWQRIIMEAEKEPYDWILLMEDDVGASLAAPEAWPISLEDLLYEAPKNCLAIQLAPINARERKHLYHEWIVSNKRNWLTSKHLVRSHGNGAILINKIALKKLIPWLSKYSAKTFPNVHPLIHPWKIRPVADKWIFGSLPKNSCYVANYPFFCLDGENSSLHSDHVNKYHIPSKQATVDIWSAEGNILLLNAFKKWVAIR